MTTHRVGHVDEVPDDGPLIVTIGRIEIGIFRVHGQLVAWRNVCPHQAAPVCRGTVTGTALPSRVYQYEYGRDREILQCPWHGWEYDLATGHHLAAGSTARLRSYPIEIQDDEIYIRTRA